MRSFLLITTSIGILAASAVITWAADPMANTPVLNRHFLNDAKGFKFGSVLVQPTLYNSVEYTSNLFKSDTNPQDDKILKTRLNILSSINRNRSETTLEAEANYWKYQEIDDLDRAGYLGILHHQYEISPSVTIGFGADAERKYQSSYDIAAAQALYKPVQSDSYGLNLDLNVNPGSIDWQFSMGYHDFKYGNTTLLSSNTPLIQEDRNKTVYDLGVEAAFEKFSTYGDEGYTPFMGISLIREDYDKHDYETGTSDFTGANQSSMQYSAVAGLNLKPTGKIRGNIKAGYSHYAPDDANKDAKNTATANIDLTYLYTPLTNFIFNAGRFFNTDTNASDIAIQTELSAKIVHELTRRWILESGIRYVERDFDSNDGDQAWDRMIGFRHPINDQFSLNGNIHYITRDSDNATGDYDETRAMLRLDTKF